MKLQTKSWIKEHILQLIIIGGMIAFGLFAFRGCGKYNNPQNHSDTTHTVVIEHHDTTIVTKPQIFHTYTDAKEINSTEYVPSENYDSLVEQFAELKQQLLEYNIYKNTYPVDTIGTVTITDTLHKNQIFGRKLNYNLNVPVKTTTITNYIYPKPKAKFYIGGTVAGSQTDILQSVGVGTLYQSKKDAVWGLNANYNFKNGLNYQLSRYFKIQFHK